MVANSDWRLRTFVEGGQAKRERERGGEKGERERVEARESAIQMHSESGAMPDCGVNLPRGQESSKIQR